jgi:hypothetical protein
MNSSISLQPDVKKWVDILLEWKKKLYFLQFYFLDFLKLVTYDYTLIMYD